MSSIDTVIRAEIVRLAKREARRLTVTLRANLVRLKKRTVEVKRQLAAIEKRLESREAREKLAATASRAAAGEVKGRLSPGLILKLRKRLGFSRQQFARLLSVSPGAVFTWEAGKVSPRPEMKARILSFRGMGRREARTLLENLAPSKRARKKRT